MPSGRSFSRRSRGFVRDVLLLCLLCVSVHGCRIRSKDPYWIEAHGHALGTRIAGWALGVVMIGTDQHLWGYPGGWNNPWEAREQSRALRAVTGAHTHVYGLLADGRAARFSGSHWIPIEGSQAWNASEISVTDNERLLVLTGGKLRVATRGELSPLACDEHPDLVAVAALSPDSAFVVDQSGSLFFNGDGRCDPVPAPVRLRRIAAISTRLVAVAVDRSLWRRRDNAWVKLPVPFKNRPGQFPAAAQPEDVGVSAHSTWVVDTEGTVYVLSDEA